jgi:hypothetical protein
VFRSLLGTQGFSRGHSSLSGNEQLTPIDLLYERFFRNHESFYDLDVLNSSSVKSYVVVLETSIYQKAIDYMSSVTKELEDSLAKRDVKEDELKESEQKE